MADINKIKEDLDINNFSDELTNSLKVGVQKAIREEKKWYKSVLTKSAVCIVLIFLVITGGSIISPTFAEQVSKIPIIGNLVSFLESDKGIKNALENQYGAEINEEYISGDYVFRITHAVRDKYNIVLFYEIACESKKNLEKISVWDIEITDEHNNKLTAVHMYQNGYVKNKNKPGIVAYGTLRLDSEYPSIEDWNEIGDILKFNAVVGEQKFNEVSEELMLKETFKIDNMQISLKECERFKEKVYEINKEITIKEDKLIIEKVEISPTRTVVYIDDNVDNKYIPLKINFKLHDGKEREWDSHILGVTQRISVSSELNNFNKIGKRKIITYLSSPYFENPEKLYMDDIEIQVVSKDKSIFYVDLDSGEISNGYDEIFKLKDINTTTDTIEFLIQKRVENFTDIYLIGTTADNITSQFNYDDYDSSRRLEESQNHKNTSYVAEYAFKINKSKLGECSKLFFKVTSTEEYLNYNKRIEIY